MKTTLKANKSTLLSAHNSKLTDNKVSLATIVWTDVEAGLRVIPNSGVNKTWIVTQYVVQSSCLSNKHNSHPFPFLSDNGLENFIMAVVHSIFKEKRQWGGVFGRMETKTVIARNAYNFRGSMCQVYMLKVQVLLTDYAKPNQ